jgi:DeoR/GlpR family transcriptional regulator of sugar metabolism
MSRSSSQKQQRQKILLEKIKYDPFLTDEELADFFKVSVHTIILDSLE